MIFPISIFLLSRLVTTHAVLNSPPPFNPNPSKTAVCGGANFVPGVTLVMNLTAGDPLSIAWQVIAGDGTGPVTATVYVNSTLQGIATDLDLNAPNVGKFQKIMTVPNVPCSNSSQPCIMNVKSSSNWFSCFAFTGLLFI